MILLFRDYCLGQQGGLRVGWLIWGTVLSFKALPDHSVSSLFFGCEFFTYGFYWRHFMIPSVLVFFLLERISSVQRSFYVWLACKAESSLLHQFSGLKPSHILQSCLGILTYSGGRVTATLLFKLKFQSHTETCFHYQILTEVSFRWVSKCISFVFQHRTQMIFKSKANNTCSP